MISAARTVERKLTFRQGFTLLEIVVVLALAAIVTGGAVGLMAYSSDERAIRDTSGQIQLLAKRARTKAILEQAPYAVEFRQGLARMMPYPLAGQKLSETEGTLPPDQVCVIPDDMQVSILRWNTGDRWLPSRGDAIHVWRFDPEGLCEPIGVRLSTKNSWQQDYYHPLTASIQTTESEIR